MTLQQLVAIYQANLGIGHLEALQAVYDQGYFAGAGITVTAQSVDVVVNQPAPTTIVKLKGVALR